MGGSLYPPMPTFLPSCLAPCVFVFVFHIKWEFSLCVGAWLLLVFGPLDQARLGLVCSGHAISHFSLSLFRTNFAVIQQMYLQAAPPCLLAHNLKTLYAFWQIACAFFSTFN